MAITSFTAGDLIRSADVNANFTEIYVTKGAQNLLVQHTAAGLHTNITGTSITVSSTITGASLSISGSAIIDDGLTITSGNITISSGNLNITSGDIALTAGDLTLSAGNADIVGNVSITGNTVASGNLTVSGNVGVTGNITASGDVTANEFTGTVNGTNLTANSVTASTKLVTASVGTEELATASVTIAKMEAVASGVSTAAGGFAISSSCGTWATATANYVDVTNLSVTLITTGRPVFIGLISDGTDRETWVAADDESVSNYPTRASFKLLRDSTDIWEAELGLSAGVDPFGDLRLQLLPGCIWHIDIPSAGTYIFKLQAHAAASAADYQAQVYRCKLVAYEL